MGTLSSISSDYSVISWATLIRDIAADPSCDQLAKLFAETKEDCLYG